LYTIIRARFSVPSEISFRAFMKQFGSLMGRLQGVVATIPNAVVSSSTGPTSSSSTGVKDSTITGVPIIQESGASAQVGTSGITATTTLGAPFGSATSNASPGSNVASEKAGSSSLASTAASGPGGISAPNGATASGHTAGAEHATPPGNTPTQVPIGTSSGPLTPSGTSSPAASGASTTQSEKEARRAAKVEALKAKLSEFAQLKSMFGNLRGALATVVKMSDDFEKSLNAHQV
jgi:hypothetical protein